VVTSEPQHIDELAYGAGFTIAAASALLTMLELKGLVVNAERSIIGDFRTPRSRPSIY